jgi:autophagy-related protein 9
MFKAANPDWNPTDPSGSLYLSRMVDFNANRSPTSIRRRSRHGYGLDSGMPGVVIAEPHQQQQQQQQQPVDLSERAQEYDRALLQSQYAARRRHQAGNGNGGTHASNTPSAGGNTITRSNIFQSTIGGMAMAETAVLGDSQGSVSLAPPMATTTATTRAGVSARQQPAPLAEEDITPDGGVGSSLGGSYVDGEELRRSKPKSYVQQEDGEDDDSENEPEGVLGLLRQVYGNTKGQGPARVI